jgi:hypothetical protein
LRETREAAFAYGKSVKGELSPTATEGFELNNNLYAYIASTPDKSRCLLMLIITIYIVIINGFFGFEDKL